MDTTWTIIEARNRWGEPAFAVAHHINKVLHGFATRVAAERYALAEAQKAAADGDETATVDEIIAGEHRHIWPPAAAAGSTGRVKRSASTRGSKHG